MTLERIAEIKSHRNVFIKLVLDNFIVSTTQQKIMENFIKSFDEMFTALVNNAEAKDLAEIVIKYIEAQTVYLSSKNMQDYKDVEIIGYELEMKILEIFRQTETVKQMSFTF